MTLNFKMGLSLGLVSAMGVIGLSVIANTSLQPAIAHNHSKETVQLAQAAQNRLVIVFASRKGSTDLENKVKAVTSFLSKQIGVPVEGIIADESAAVEAIRANRADVAFLGSRAAIKTAQTTGAKLYLAEVRDDYSGGHTYKSVLVVRKDSPLKPLKNEKQTLGQLKGKTMAFASRTSGSGFIIPTSSFVGGGFVSEPDRFDQFFGKVIYGDGYPSALQAVLKKQADVAAVSEYALKEPWITAQEAQQLRVLWGIPGVPAHGIVIDDDVSASLRNKIVAAFLKLNEPSNNAMFQSLYNSTKLVKVDHDKHVAPMQRALQRAKINP
ncbi:MAG: phosphate/phosphite/phosphonate ABC transporter substrate-binding protein [Snowella sp.]|nr:phosphate/phosphite/phosphonate ABC transporter substrate-binding protein [Snowella sp.]